MDSTRVKSEIEKNYIIINDNSSLIRDHSVCICIKTHLIVCEMRRLSYFLFHVNRCKKQSDILKLTLMAIATIVLIVALLVSIVQEAEVLKSLIFPVTKIA